MVAAGLLAKKAVEKGLSVEPWVKTSLAPGSRVVTDYLKKAGLDTVDLRPALKSVQTGKQTSFYRADYHWTAWASEAP